MNSINHIRRRLIAFTVILLAIQEQIETLLREAKEMKMEVDDIERNDLCVLSGESASTDGSADSESQ